MSFAILLELVCYVHPPETKEDRKKEIKGGDMEKWVTWFKLQPHMSLNTARVHLNCTKLNKEYTGFIKEMFWRLHKLNSVNSICDIISIHSSVIKIKGGKIVVI